MSEVKYYEISQIQFYYWGQFYCINYKTKTKYLKILQNYLVNDRPSAVSGTFVCALEIIEDEQHNDGNQYQEAQCQSNYQPYVCARRHY